MKRFEGHSAVVTGAARGIGLEISRGLLERGARVILSDVDRAVLEEALFQVEGVQGKAEVCVADVASAAQMGELAERLVGGAEGPCIWVNNAGLARHRAVTDYTEAEVEQMLDVNLKGTILGSQAALRVMAPLGRGHIVNVISTASLRGIPKETVYCAAKWGVRGFTHGLREEAAPMGIRVSAVLPGGVDTAFWRDAVDRPMPVGDFLSAADVAEAVMHLLEMPSHMVPQELVVRSMRDRDFAHA